MTYEQRLQKEAEELARLDYPHARPEVIKGISGWHKYQNQAIYLLAKQAEEYREGYKIACIDGWGEYDGTDEENVKEHLIDNGLVPQTKQDEEITE